jgi:Flp pilus assembly pilin Flp
MTTILKRLVVDQSAQDLAEYGIALAVIGVGVALAAIAIGGNISTLWSKANSIIATTV